MGQPQKRKATQRIDPNSAVSALILMSGPGNRSFVGTALTHRAFGSSKPPDSREST